jgi:centractin
MPHSILRNDVAGRDVTRYLKLLLRKEGYTFKTTAEFEIVKSIKERVCFLSPTAQKDETGQGDKSQFTLPDGTSIEVRLNLFFSILNDYFSLEQVVIVHRKFSLIRN